MRYTQNANFVLPEYADVVDIEQLNENFEKIDEHIGDGVTEETPTSLSGLFKGNGASVEVAVAGVDYGKPIQQVSGSTASVSVTVADATEYIYTGITSLAITYPSGSFECWLKVTTGASITITFPSGTTYLGAAPEFEANKTYEISIKNGVVAAAEVVSE